MRSAGVVVCLVLATSACASDPPERALPAEPVIEDDGPMEDVRETTLAGRQAVRIEGRTSGLDLLPPGLRTTTWLVDLGSSTLLATTADVPRVDDEAAVPVLDAMAASVQAS